ncbi:hypothetical protein I5Q49_09295 [Pseudomonas carnis]|uniref:hypothetical protein n=1 Tax=Pseudomonas carnis TaxID=2487355 RepID=UPI0018DA278B|nr:hypothetical protein [Pseudomonas carnis]MBH3465040.1 hypothetical protein [Pseudomonas carnis]
MDLINKNRFNETVTHIFEALTVAFPLPTDISAETLGLTSGPAYKIVNNTQVPAEGMEAYGFVAACVRWLESADYLRASKIYPSSARDVLLTEKGLQLLDALPMSLLRGNYTE